jgi:hypothetical protein
MKLLRILLLVAVSGVLLTYVGCKGGEGTPEPIADVQFDKLKKAWKINTVSLDGVDKTADYTAFQLTLSGTKGTYPFDYATSGRPNLSPWKASGKVDFGASPETQLIRDKATPGEELAMTYTVTETTLTIEFTFNRDGYPARTSQVRGAWIFVFKL